MSLPGILSINSAISGSPAFGIVQTPNGTSPAADQVNDTLSLTSSDSSITITGDATTDTVNLVVGIRPTVTISASSIDWSAGLVFKKTLSANTTFTFANTTDGQTIVVAITNTASNFTVTWPSVRWNAGTPPTQTVGAFTDVYTFIKIGIVFYGSVVQNMS